MTTPGFTIGERASDLRRQFDQAFGEPPPSAVGGTVDLLGITVGGSSYALRVAELSGLASGRRIVPVPSRRRELLGVVGIRGGLIAVYSLAALLDAGASPSSGPWLVLCGGTDAIALAFEHVDGFFRVSTGELRRHEPTASSRPHLSEAVRIGPVTRWIIEAQAAAVTVKKGAGASGSTKER